MCIPVLLEKRVPLASFIDIDKYSEKNEKGDEKVKQMHLKSYLQQIAFRTGKSETLRKYL